MEQETTGKSVAKTGNDFRRMTTGTFLNWRTFPMSLDTKTMSDLLVVGWKEYIAFPDWNLSHVRAKVDTGACSSALGVIHYRLVTENKPDDFVWLRLALYPNHPNRIHEIKMPVLGLVTVKNSSGKKETRPVIHARIQIGPITKVIRMTLAKRTGMRYAILLGKEALAGDFVVDVSKRYCQPRS